ncbi:MAG: YkgJ family cysteine cluster protein [Clostridiales bacterium]|nr:YkgJ family cysteine cluster protein [Clostridiales bacterium]
MDRNCSLDEISDGRFYGVNDMVKADCNDCQGCSACCRGMGSSIVLDPLDIYRLCAVDNQSFEQLLADKIELNVVKGLILPNLRMAGESEQCAYLNEEGRCSIHSFRPGICRIFPLGRVYEDHSFQYILQVHECQKSNKTKVKVSKWIDTPDLKKNEEFIITWHYFMKDLQQLIQSQTEEAQIKQLNMYVLNVFFLKAYDTTKDFYDQFHVRMEESKKVISSLSAQ